MAIFLAIIAVISYAMAFFAVAVSKSDIQVILSALCVLTGTVALIGLAVLNRMKSIAELMVAKKPSARSADSEV